jgi:hypothetical protein
MRRIIWIASYPKSGNTWMRAFLANYVLDRREPLPINELGAFTLSDTRPRFYQEAAGKPIGEITEGESLTLRARAQTLIAAARPHDHFVKTHCLNGVHHGVRLISPEVTKGAICITRNPLDLVSSYASHFNLAIDLAIDAMADPGNSTIDVEHRIFTLLGNWSDHVKSWRDGTDFPMVMVRYEDLLSRPEAAFQSVVQTLGLPFDGDRLRRALSFSSFKELSAQEGRNGFTERPPHAERFFREGKAGAWRDRLSTAQIDKISTTHGDVMAALGYL